jgi:hypothetical protein
MSLGLSWRNSLRRKVILNIYSGLNDAEIIEAFEKAKSVKEEMKAKELEKEKELINKVQ